MYHSPASEVLALADDLTGALEVGAQFADAGIDAEVWTRVPDTVQAAALVVDTRTRHLSAEEAASRVRAVLPKHAPRFLFKKTDSTLRGHIGPELRALHEAYPDRTLIYAPAYPALGRCVRDGHLYVHGRLVHETEFANDALNPVRTSDVRTLCPAAALARSTKEFEQLMDAAPVPGAVICDASNDDDLATLAEVALKSVLPLIAVGPGAFARSWAMALPVARSPQPQISIARRGLIVCGSRHPASLGQVARISGLPLCHTADELSSAFTKGDWAALLPPAPVQQSATEVARQLGRIATGLMRWIEIDALIVFGGDTAASVMEALDVECVRSCGELLTGVPVSLMSCPRQVSLVTKAGGFGGPAVLEEILHRLKG